MGLSASTTDRRAENYANGKHDASRRKPLMLIISAAVASVAIGTVVLAGAAVLNYEPAQQHVEFEITPPNK
jgi:hypothetical protein